MGKHSKDEVNAPSWVNKEFFEIVLKSYRNNSNISVQEFLIKPGTTAGEHFASVLFKVSIVFINEKGVKEELRTVIKLLPNEDGYKKEILQNQPSFVNEIRMYTKVLPQLERVLAGVGIKTTFGPP